MYLVVGLGNPGEQYHKSRHNLGFLILDRIVADLGGAWNKQKFHGLWAKESYQGQPVIWVKPMTFMNLSGKCVREFQTFYKVDNHNTIVIHDDIDMPFAKVKIKMNGGHGGHNGIRNVILETGQNDFARIKVGAGRPVDKAVSHFVLDHMSGDELEVVGTSVMQEVKDRLDTLLR